LQKNIDSFLYKDTTQYYSILPTLDDAFLKISEERKLDIAILLQQIAANKTTVVKVEIQLLFRTIVLKDKNENVLRSKEAMLLLKDFIFYIDMMD
jgi:hypothetical protein